MSEKMPFGRGSEIERKFPDLVRFMGSLSEKMAEYRARKFLEEPDIILPTAHELADALLGAIARQIIKRRSAYLEKIVFTKVDSSDNDIICKLNIDAGTSNVPTEHHFEVSLMLQPIRRGTDPQNLKKCLSPVWTLMTSERRSRLERAFGRSKR